MKSKVLVSSILTIALCLSLIAGSTFALFTSSSENNIAVQAAKVKMAATIDNLALTSVRPATVAEIRAAEEGDKSVNIIEDEFGGQYVYIDCANGTFPNGGTATFENAKLSLNRITPRDKVSFDIVGSNTSDVAIQYRYVIECFDGQKLMSGLLVSIDGVTYEYLGAYTSGWKTLNPGTDMDTVPVVIDFPVNKGNEFQEESTSIRVVVEAIQGNADVTGSNEPTAEFLDNLNLDLSGKSMPIPAGVVNTGNLTLANGAIAIDQVGLENTGNATLTNMVIDGGTPGRVAYGYSVIGRGENSVTVLNDVTVNSANGAISAADGAQVTFNGGSVEVNSASTSGRYLFYAEGAGTVITINDGNFDFNKTQNQKRAYVYAGAGSTVYINGGTFGEPSNRGDYKAGIKGDGTVIITGGTFGFDPTNWVAGGYEAVKSGDTWTVQPSTKDLADILTGNEKHIIVNLTEDVDLPITSLGSITPGSGEYKLGGENTETITINLNGHKLNLTTGYWSAIGAKNDNATITIKNGSMTSTGNSTETWNGYDVRFCNCNYVIENVTFDKAVALDNAGKSTTMKNVTINESKDVYALWITADGQTVDIDGLTVNTPGRGIKIDEQYVDAPAKVTLNVSNAKFDTSVKAAIMVKSAAGADIALNDVDISAVAADPVNHVWVDANSIAYADLVTVTGGNKINEP